MVVNLGSLSRSSDPEFGCTVAGSFQEVCVCVLPINMEHQGCVSLYL